MHPPRVLLADDHPSLAAAIGKYVAPGVPVGRNGSVVEAIRMVVDGGTYILSAIAL